MDLRISMLWVIIGTGLVTVVPRMLPMIVLSRFTLPDRLVRWLGYVPVAVLSALLAQAVLLVHNHIALPPQNPAVLAIVPTLAVAVRTRSLAGTVLTGVVAMALLRLVFG